MAWPTRYNEIILAVLVLAVSLGTGQSVEAATSLEGIAIVPEHNVPKYQRRPDWDDDGTMPTMTA